MLDERDLVTYARGAAAALRTLGPTSRDDVLGMLRALQLTQAQAVEVIAHALAHEILVEEEDGRLRSSPSA